MAILTDAEFDGFRRFIAQAAGISLGDAKKPLVCGRLARRLQARGLASYGDYLDLLEAGDADDEVQVAIDLLTTNETYFFREQVHFDHLRRIAREAAAAGRGLSVWSAACSSGEETYSAAMVLDDCLGSHWSLLGTDISRRMLQAAACGHYPEARTRFIPRDYLQRYCLRGTGSQAGTLLVERTLRQRVAFAQRNLDRPLPEGPPYDVVFLRNVMIYFDQDTRRRVVARVLQALRPGGWLFIGRSESLHGIVDGIAAVEPAVYRKR